MATQITLTVNGQIHTLGTILTQAKFRDSARRASAEYRRHIVGGLFQDVLGTAWLRAT